MSNHPHNSSESSDENKILYLDFYRKVDEADKVYVRGLISTLFGGQACTLKIGPGDSEKTLKVTGDNIFQINRLKQAFDQGLNRVFRVDVGKELPDPLKLNPEPFPVKLAPDKQEGRKFIRSALNRLTQNNKRGQIRGAN